MAVKKAVKKQVKKLSPRAVDIIGQIKASELKGLNVTITGTAVAYAKAQELWPAFHEQCKKFRIQVVEHYANDEPQIRKHADYKREYKDLMLQFDCFNQIFGERPNGKK